MLAIPIRTRQGKARALILAKTYDSIIQGRPAELDHREFRYGSHTGHTIRNLGEEFHRQLSREEFLAELHQALSAEFAGSDWQELHRRNFTSASAGDFQFAAYGAV